VTGLLENRGVDRAATVAAEAAEKKATESKPPTARTLRWEADNLRTKVGKPESRAEAPRQQKLELEMKIAEAVGGQHVPDGPAAEAAPGGAGAAGGGSCDVPEDNGDDDVDLELLAGDDFAERQAALSQAADALKAAASGSPEQLAEAKRKYSETVRKLDVKRARREQSV
ncbi:unnamed protein product, partial [Prorocentrum cordatum]